MAPGRPREKILTANTGKRTCNNAEQDLTAQLFGCNAVEEPGSRRPSEVIIATCLMER